jgi:hypothetical protein
MISDVIHDALREIEQYEREYPASCASIAMELDEMKRAMRGVMKKLDTPPGRDVEDVWPPVAASNDRS